MKLFCQRCMNDNLIYLYDSGPHFKGICSKCNRYIKFVPTKTLPDLKSIRIAIWLTAKQDLKKIEELKIKHYCRDKDHYTAYFNILTDLKLGH